MAYPKRTRPCHTQPIRFDKELMDKAFIIASKFPRLNMSNVVEDSLAFLIETIEKEHGSVENLGAGDWKYTYSPTKSANTRIK